MKQDNKGWSFVELIIAIAIVSVLFVLIGFGYSMVSGKPAEACAQKIVSTLQNSRTLAQGKYMVSCEIAEDSTTGEIVLTRTTYTSYDEYVAGTPSVDTTVIGESGVTVEYTLDDGSHYSIDTTPLVLSYDRATGGFLTVTPTASCISITVSRASKVMTIELVPPTGRVSIN